MDHAAGDEKFKHFFIRHLDFAHVPFRNEEKKSRDGMGSCRHKDRDQRGIHFLLAFLRDFADVESDRVSGRGGEGKDHWVFERFFSFAGKKGMKHLSADFVNRFDEGDPRNQEVGSVQEFSDQKPAGGRAEKEDEDGEEDQSKEARDEEVEEIGKENRVNSFKQSRGHVLYCVIQLSMIGD